MENQGEAEQELEVKADFGEPEVIYELLVAVKEVEGGKGE